MTKRVRGSPSFAWAGALCVVALGLNACGPAPSSEYATVATIGPEGGTLALADGTSLEIPVAALSFRVEISLSRALQPPPPPEGARALGPTYTLMPQGTAFAIPATMIVAYTVQPAPGEESVIMVAPSGTSLYAALASEPLDPSHLRALTTGLSDFVVAGRSSCPSKAACTDGDACTFGDRCDRGVCTGTPYACDDGNPCTADACDGAGGCVFVANTSPCDDGDPCTHGDACSAGSCAGVRYGCDDGNPCTNDSCDAAGGCAHVNNSTPCDDGDPCTLGDGCWGGSCRGIPNPGCGSCSCDDGNECTTDTCDAAGNCVFTNHTWYCDDGDPCTVSERCSGGVCQGGYVCDSCMNCQGSGPCPDQYVCDITTECCVLHCGNGLWDGGEGDVDCGMVCGNYCAPGQHCIVDWDCSSLNCVNGVCQ